MKHKLSILFFVKSSKATKSGLVPIYQRITINGARIELSTSKFVERSKWNASAGKIKGTNEEARLINSHLDILRSKVYETENWMINNSQDINAQTFKNKFLGVEEKQRQLILIFEDHNKRMKELIGSTFANNTFKKYETTLSHIKEFLKVQYNLNDISIKRVDIAFINDFDFFLRHTKKCNNNSTIKYIRNFGKIIKQCYVNGWLERDPMLNYKGKVKEIERVYLAQEEIELLLNKEFKIKRLELVRDMFLFSCFTGLAYIDVYNLTNSNIIIGIDGEKWISTKRQKTESPSRIPILPVSQMIIDKYENHPQCKNEGKLLPILSNQKMNAYLKELADVCEIDKELTFHIARHTFATIVTLTNGVPIESVSKMLGHKNIRTTQHYAKVLDKKVSEDMKILKDKFLINIISKKANN
ncbi:MAG TPA: site-specific integrase [Flavobacterium sp.]|uniref:site-specific integrase n=2 Tax=Flavobacterium TaxID=237 RepID=UPI0025BC3070|nr:MULTISPECIES: site-specific integrase [unclassified Flavobacterium]HRE76765.1 site-specific integrase [Flavobacterium sp.]